MARWSHWTPGSNRRPTTDVKDARVWPSSSALYAMPPFGQNARLSAGPAPPTASGRRPQSTPPTGAGTAPLCIAAAPAPAPQLGSRAAAPPAPASACLLYTSDAADDTPC
eukprot:6089953-Pyramimonas_sp.AAC.1